MNNTNIAINTNKLDGVLRTLYFNRDGNPEKTTLGMNHRPLHGFPTPYFVGGQTELRY